VNTLLDLPGAPVHAPLPDKPASDLTRAWRHEVVHHPFAYLRVRAQLWLRQVSITRPPWWIFHPGIDPNPWGLRVRFPALDSAANSYVEAFASDVRLGGPGARIDGSVIHMVAIYLALALAGAVALLRRGRPVAHVIGGALCASAVTYQIGLFFGATGVQYRLEFPVVVIGLISVCLMGALVVRRVRGRGLRSSGRDSEPPAVADGRRPGDAPPSGAIVGDDAAPPGRVTQA
jgi:hypothetical protein